MHKLYVSVVLPGKVKSATFIGNLLIKIIQLSGIETLHPKLISFYFYFTKEQCLAGLFSTLFFMPLSFLS